MRAKEFIINEAPLEQVPQEKSSLFRQAWQHQFVEPGELWDDGNDPRPPALGNPFQKGSGVKRLGTGAEATVFKRDDENGVHKIIGTRQDLKNNAHLQYLLATKKYASSNPYLPRVLSMQELPQVSSDSDVRGFVVKTERLWPLEQLSKDEYHTLAVRIFGPDPAELDWFKTDSDFATYVRRGITGTAQRSVIDPAFTQAVKIIYAAADRTGSVRGSRTMFDLHAGNMMFRRTKFGPQLVITDPLYNGDERVFNT